MLVSKVVQKHAPLKKKILRGNHAPFINREFRKEIHKQSLLRNKFGMIHLRKMNFCLRPKETNVSHCGESVLNHTFKMLLRKVLTQISKLGVSLNLF